MSFREQTYGETKRRCINFAVLCLLLCVVGVALFENFETTTDITQENREILNRTFKVQLDWLHTPILLAVGIVVGILAGLLGMGGGAIQVAAFLLLLKMDMHIAGAATMITMFFASIFAVWHQRKTQIDFDWIWRPILPAALFGTALGLGLALLLSTHALTTLFGFFMFFLGVFMFTQAFSLHDRNVGIRNSRSKILGKVEFGIGMLHGIFCGLLGISGGVVTTPMQQILCDTPIRRAIIVSLILSIPCTLLGSTLTIIYGLDRGTFTMNQIIFASLFPIIGAFIGTQIGTYVSGITNRTSLLILFAIIYFIASFSILS